MLIQIDLLKKNIFIIHKRMEDIDYYVLLEDYVSKFNNSFKENLGFYLSYNEDKVYKNSVYVMEWTGEDLKGIIVDKKWITYNELVNTNMEIGLKRTIESFFHK